MVPAHTLGLVSRHQQVVDTFPAYHLDTTVHHGVVGGGHRLALTARLYLLTRDIVLIVGIVMPEDTGVGSEVTVEHQSTTQLRGCVAHHC